MKTPLGESVVVACAPGETVEAVREKAAALLGYDPGLRHKIFRQVPVFRRPSRPIQSARYICTEI